MEPIDHLNSNILYVGSCSEKENVIKDLFLTALTTSIKEVDEKNYYLIQTLMKYENEINRCIDMSNYYINEAHSSNLKSEKVRRKLRIHIYTIFKDGEKEINYPSDIKYEDSVNIYKYVTPSSFTFNIHGYILNSDENESCEKEKSSFKGTYEHNTDNLEKKCVITKEMDNENSYSELDDISENNEHIDYYNTNAMKFTSFFSTIMVIRDKETIIYDKKNKSYYDCDKLTFTRIIGEKKNETIKIFLFLDQKVPFFELSPQLKKFMQSSEETLPEIIKCIYEYSLEKDLVDSCNMKTDEVLRDILEVDEYEFSELPKLLKKHISIQKPIVLEHTIDLENTEESESIYDIVIDTFEPYVSFEDGHFKKFVLDSHHLTKLLEFLKNNDNDDVINNKINEATIYEYNNKNYHNNNCNDKSGKNKKQKNEFSLIEKNQINYQKITNENIVLKENQENENKNMAVSIKNNNHLIDGNNESMEKGKEKEENIKIEEDEKKENNEKYLKKENFESGLNKMKDRENEKVNLKKSEEQIYNNEWYEFFDENKKNANIATMGISIFEKINGIQKEIDDINEKIINILCKIKHKNSLRLHYKHFYENPCEFIDYIMNSKFSVDYENINDNNYIYEQAVNINDDNYYKLPWIHRGISKYLLIKNKNFDDVLKSVLNSMNLEYKRKLNINSDANKKQKMFLRTEKVDPHKGYMNYICNTQQEVKNNAYYYPLNKNMSYAEPFNSSTQDYGNDMNYVNNNIHNPSFNITSNTYDRLTKNITIQNNYMQNNEQDSFCSYNQQGAYSQYMNAPFNELAAENNLNPMYNMASMEMYQKEGFYNSNNVIP
ncbi:SWI/SNF-related matrix-associated actin-dependent regulator of chromatin, putative [Plasmodium relictum]|uniref:SWI/SNF-related matrix-associated actin-dependent regulator of chromatin, putative n=1 Tax=Plasmodium relictum TaxID=85471 RepID=A0A1J1H8N8_PLARL|nr:SWI/SNF-related matrix-associated actin-dependent regulator of chromatin, putative [Plasmodium relictum]CRH01021.1 SWI/SNF-related matrix-associated actin-dependent regulator of chromatin, putative [Plasmodium relictum]